MVVVNMFVQWFQEKVERMCQLTLIIDHLNIKMPGIDCFFNFRNGIQNFILLLFSFFIKVIF
jgi:hypothetical protein